MKLPSFRLPERIGWRDHVIGALLGLAYVLALLSTARTIGFVRDEGVYFRAATNYVGWLRLLLEHGRSALSQGAIDGPWGDNHEHPALMKTLFGISWWLFHERLPFFADATTAYRFPAMCSAGMAIWVTYLFGARAFGRVAGAVGAVLLGLMPHVFFHAHLACFDVPMMAFWVLCVYVHYRAQHGGLLWAIATGVVFGLALETKHNAWMLPAVLVPHALFVHRQAIWAGLKAGKVVIPSSLVSMALIGPLVFYALWPYLWNDTLARVEWWFQFHLNHEYYNIEYLGRNYFGPPSPHSYLPFLVVATVPTITVLLFFVGGLERVANAGRRLDAWALGKLRRASGPTPAADPNETDLLLALSFLVAVGPFFLDKTPIFGGTKHWLPAYPALALFAGRGFQLARNAMHDALPRLDSRRRWGAEAALAASVIVAPLAVTAHSNPYGIAAYVPIVGGTAGGADLGLNRQFWGYTAQNAATEYLNEKAPQGATVYIHDTTWDAWAHMVDEGRVRRDLRVVWAPHEAQFSLVEHELHMNEIDYSTWVAFGTDAPAYIVEHDGVPIVSVYRRP